RPRQAPALVGGGDAGIDAEDRGHGARAVDGAGGEDVVHAGVVAAAPEVRQVAAVQLGCALEDLAQLMDGGSRHRDARARRQRRRYCAAGRSMSAIQLPYWLGSCCACALSWCLAESASSMNHLSCCSGWCWKSGYWPLQTLVRICK